MGKWFPVEDTATQAFSSTLDHSLLRSYLAALSLKVEVKNINAVDTVKPVGCWVGH